MSVTNKANAIGSIYRRDGAYVFDWYDALGKRHAKRVPKGEVSTKRTAKKWALDWLATNIAAPSQGALTLAAFLDRWLFQRDENPNVRASTTRNNRIHAKYILAGLGHVQLAELTAPMVRDFVRALRTAERSKARTGKDGKPMGLSSHYMHRIHSSLMLALDDAEFNGLINANPARNPLIKRELPKPVNLAGKNVVIYVKREHAERVCSSAAVAVDRRLRWLILLLAGLRPAELNALDWDDVDLDSEIPTVDINKGSTNTDNQAPKTDNSYRVVPLHPLAARALRAWRHDGWIKLVGHRPRPADPLFPKPDGTHFASYKSARKFRADLLTAGCPSTFKGHDLDAYACRRSFATWLRDADVNEGLRRRLMGHSAANVTDAHYTAKELRELYDAVCKLTLDLSTGEVVQLPFRVAAGES